MSPLAGLKPPISASMGERGIFGAAIGPGRAIVVKVNGTFGDMAGIVARASWLDAEYAHSPSAATGSLITARD
jgi:hypothetical protein